MSNKSSSSESEELGQSSAPKQSTPPPKSSSPDLSPIRPAQKRESVSSPDLSPIPAAKKQRTSPSEPSLSPIGGPARRQSPHQSPQLSLSGISPIAGTSKPRQGSSPDLSPIGGARRQSLPPISDLSIGGWSPIGGRGRRSSSQSPSFSLSGLSPIHGGRRQMDVSSPPISPIGGTARQRDERQSPLFEGLSPITGFPQTRRSSPDWGAQSSPVMFRSSPLGPSPVMSRHRSLSHMDSFNVSGLDLDRSVGESSFTAASPTPAYVEPTTLLEGLEEWDYRFLAGNRPNSYSIERKLGSGTMSYVYLGRNRRSNELVAIKMSKLGIMGTGIRNIDMECKFYLFYFLHQF